MANPRGQQREKPFRDALRMEVAAAGDDSRKLRAIARKLLEVAESGDIQAIREVGDRLDGKPAQEANVTVHRESRDMSDDELADIAAGSGDGVAEAEIHPALAH